VIDTVRGGPAKRPDFIKTSMTYPLLNATSAGIADFVDRRRKGQPVFGQRSAGPDTNSADAENVTN
jgi:membrane protein required for colicin V production